MYSAKKILIFRRKKYKKYLKRLKRTRKRNKNNKKKAKKKLKMLEKAKEEVLENELIQQYINTNSDLSKIHQISHIIYEQVNDTKYYQNKKLLKYVKNCKKNNIISF